MEQGLDSEGRGLEHIAEDVACEGAVREAAEAGAGCGHLAAGGAQGDATGGHGRSGVSRMREGCGGGAAGSDRAAMDAADASQGTAPRAGKGEAGSGGLQSSRTGTGLCDAEKRRLIGAVLAPPLLAAAKRL